MVNYWDLNLAFHFPFDAFILSNLYFDFFPDLLDLHPDTYQLILHHIILIIDFHPILDILVMFFLILVLFFDLVVFDD